MHPSQELFRQKSDMLLDKKIVLGITGSIAAVECVKLIHELIRHGASVNPVMTKAATEIINPEAVYYASGNEPVIKLTGAIEHVELCGDIRGKADLFLIAPCTANTISKIANGIDDTPVTTCATTAIGSKIPILIVPAMHGSMYEHPILQNNIEKLKAGNLDIEILAPEKTENKYKLPTIDTIVARAIRKLWINDMKEKRVLVIAGATSEEVDDMRVLTNKSSGNTGLELIKQAYFRGAAVDLWLGSATVKPINYVQTKRFKTVDDLIKMVTKLNNSGKNYFDIIIVCAAISDYSLPSGQRIKGKLPSGKSELTLRFVPTPKILKLIQAQSPKSYIIGFKAESGLSQNELIRRATSRMNDWNLNMMVANDLKKVTEKTNEVIIIHPKGDVVKVNGSKEKIAKIIFDEVLK